jgi:hypothetical protein
MTNGAFSCIIGEGAMKERWLIYEGSKGGELKWIMNNE